MARRQGVRRLKNGFVRAFTISELNRGYVFISNDAAIQEILESQDFDLVINGQTVPSRRLDKFGRIMVPRAIMHEIIPNKHYSFSLRSSRCLVIEKHTGENV